LLQARDIYFVMGDIQRLVRINTKIEHLNRYLDEIKEERRELASEMGAMVGEEFLEAFEELGKIDSEIENVKRERICLEILRDYIE
jgi:seryl-tRNA synthetase